MNNCHLWILNILIPGGYSKYMYILGPYLSICRISVSQLGQPCTAPASCDATLLYEGA